MRDDGWSSDDDIPVADLSEGVRKRRVSRRTRLRRFAALALAVVVVGAGVLVAARSSHNDNGVRQLVDPGTQHAVKGVDDGHSRADVLAALRVTTGSGSFKIHYHLSETPAPVSTTTTVPSNACGTNALAIPADGYIVPACGYAGSEPHDVAISGDGVVNVNPTAMVTSSQVPGLGLIVTRVNGTDVWEEGGGNYGMAAGSGSTIAPGAPLSQFAGLVMGTLGRREGAIAMNSMASPTGYLDLAQQAITATSSLGDSVVDGVRTRDYEVAIDSSQDRSGLTPEEARTAAAAQQVLAEEGYRATIVRLSIDGLGFIRRAQTTVTFADGGTVNADTTFSDFGCSTVAITLKGPSIVSDPAACAPSSPTSDTTAPPTTHTTAAPTTETTAAPTTETTAAPTTDTTALPTTATTPALAPTTSTSFDPVTATSTTTP